MAVCYKKIQPGFTLIELLLVIGIIGILSSTVITAINPYDQLRKAFGQERVHFARQLEKSIVQYVIDYEEYPSDTVFSTNVATPTPICRLGESDPTCANIDLIVPEFMSCLPYDTVETNPLLSGFSAYERTGKLTIVAVHDNPSSPGEIECSVPPETFAGVNFTQPLANTFYDATNTYTITANNMVAPSGLTTNAPAGAAGSWLFDGVNDYLSIPHSSAFNLTTSLSVVAWVYPTSFTTADVVNSIVRKGEANPNTWQFAIEDSRPTLLLEQSDGFDGRAQGPILALNTWHHLAATWDGTTARVYVNGAEVDSGPYTGSVAGALATDTRPIYIGGRPTSDNFAGNLYDVRVFDSKLTTIQIQRIMNGQM